MTQEQMNELEARIRELLKGIDMEELYGDEGWWETSTGAKWGKKTLEDLILLIKEYVR